MSARGRFARWCLDAAARRWPAELRDEMTREWHAELAAIEAESHGERHALAFALSLLTSPPFRDRTGAPRGWAETTGPLAPAAALLLTGLFTLGVSQLAGTLTSMLGVSFLDSFAPRWPGAVVEGVLVAAWCLVAGRWLGRRLPMEPTARLGPATSAAFAPLLLSPALLAPAFTEGDPIFLLSLVIGLLIWVPGVATLGVARARARSGLGAVLLGLPLITAAAAAAATVPMIVSSREGLSGGLRAAGASLLGSGPTVEYTVIAEGELSGRTFYEFGPWAITLIAFGVLALAYAAGAVRPLPRRVPVTGAAEEGEPATVPAAIVATGAAAVALAVVGWAYTLAILGPAMPLVSENAPMPGGDGEIYLWVAELRWGAILLAVLAMLVATADRRRAVPAALALGAALLLANGVLVRSGAEGAGGLRLALLVGGVAVVVAWLVARGPLPRDGVARAMRRRVAAGAVLAAACGPLLLTQGTPGVNHPFLPAGLTLTTTGLGVLGVLLAAIPATALSRRRLPAYAMALLIVLPAAAVAGAGLAPVDTTSDDTGPAAFGSFVGVPLAVVVVALLRRHRQRRRGRTTALWALLTLAGLPATLGLWLATVFLLQIAPNLLFATEGLGYPADGISVLPSAALLLVPLATLIGNRLDGTPGHGPAPTPQPSPDPRAAREPAGL